ncbi:MAG TPA: ComEC/Rec2 family competence protein, partial [Thermaerobacter sp.]
PSVLRATATYLLADLGRALARPATALAMLAWAAAVQLLFRPLWLFEPGFQLSFAATLGLVVLFPPLWRGLRRWPGWRRLSRGRRQVLWAAEALALTVAAQAAVLPVQVALFGRMPLAGLLGNLIAVPISGAALVGTVLAAAGGWLCSLLDPLAAPAAAAAARALGWPARLAIEGLVRTAMAAEALPLSALTVPSAAAGPLAGAVAWIMAGVIDPRPAYARRLRPRGLPGLGRFWPALLLVAAAWGAARVAQAPPAPGTFEALFLDVGHGDAILLRFPGGRTLQVDTGGRARVPEPGSYWPGLPPAIPDAVGENVTAPVLRRLLGGPLDVLAVTHADRDHAGGAGAVLEQVGARQLWLGGVPGSRLEADLIGVARRRGVPVLRPRAGTRWVPSPGCEVEVLHPGDRPVQSQRAAENNASLVLRAHCGGPRLLLVGDLEREGEQALLARGADLRADVLKVSHHGSRGASHPAFLAAVRPRLAIVSAGPNPYGLPHVEALARLLRVGAVVLRTDELGSIRVRFGRAIEVFPSLPAGGGHPAAGGLTSAAGAGTLGLKEAKDLVDNASKPPQGFTAGGG